MGDLIHRQCLFEEQGRGAVGNGRDVDTKVNSLMSRGHGGQRSPPLQAGAVVPLAL